MKISKAAWHYRFNNTVKETQLATRVFTTCSYIRFTLLNMLGLAVSFSALALVAAWALVVIGSMLYLPIALLLALPVVKTVATAGVVGWIITGVALFAIGVEKLQVKYKAHRKEKELGLLLQAAEDRKNGVCTLVEFE